MNALLFGLGRISKLHLNAIKTNGLSLIGVSDLITSNLKGFNDHYNNRILVNQDYIKLLDQNSNIVIIATDSDKHFELSKAAIEKHNHIIVEKPVSLSLHHIDSLISLSRKNKVKATVSHQNRFNKPVQRLFQSIEKNHFGKLFYGVASIRWNRNQAYYDQADWRGKWRSDGGALMNQSIHNIDLLLWIMGSPVVEVFGYIDNKNHPSIEVEDTGIALLKFANGSYGIIESSMNTYPENFEETLSIFGEKGTVVLGGKSVNKIVHWNVKDDLIDDLKKFNEEVDSVYGNGHIALYKDFIEAIEQDREPAITLQDGRNAVEVILAIYLSSFEKRPVQLPLPADTSTIMFEGKSFK
jgi:UDP-N-acetyl-2-amino-2-deoxyglucuronate dehydrogenase